MLAETYRLLAEGGIGGVSIDEIARRTGVAKTTIYRHWPSRAALQFHSIRGSVAASWRPVASFNGAAMPFHSIRGSVAASWRRGAVDDPS